MEINGYQNINSTRNAGGVNAPRVGDQFHQAPPGGQMVCNKPGIITGAKNVSNNPNLAHLREMDVTEVSRLPIDHLAALLEDVAAQKADTKQIDEKLSDALNIRFGQTAAEMRRAAKKDTGRVSLSEGDFIIRADLPKKVEWDAEKLGTAVDAIRGWGEDPAEYVTMKIVVPESKYNAWPAMIRNVFEPARVVGTGKPSFVIERGAA